MKKITLLLVLFVNLFSFSQEIVVIGHKRPPMNLSLNYNGLAGSYFGLSFEMGDYTDTGVSSILNGNYGIMTVSKNGVSGNGYSLEAGGRQYIIMNQSYARFYMENLVSYSRIEFSDAKYSGVYEYVSFINPSIGYKFRLGDHFTMDPFGGFSWRNEIMSRGDVNNKDFSNFVGKLGLKVGYSF